jgi:hypothetical protein
MQMLWYPDNKKWRLQLLSGFFKEASSLLTGLLDRLALQLNRKASEFYHRYKTVSKVQTRTIAKKVEETGAN